MTSASFTPILASVFPRTEIIEADPWLGAIAASLLVIAAVGYVVYQAGMKRRG